VSGVDDRSSVGGGPSALEAIATTRAIRRYTADTIPDDHLSQILWSATRAPSGSNRQPFRFLVLRDGPVAREAKALLGSAFRAGWETKRSTDGYATGSAQRVDSPKARMAATMQHYVDHFEEIPVVVLACLVRHRAPNPYEGASVYPACQNLLLAARALGYGGALTMWHQMVEPDLRELLGIPDEVALSATVTLGVPAGSHGPVRRRPLAELVFDDRWGSAAEWAHDPEGTGFTQAGPPVDGR
jgi:nitroreductase